MRTSQHADGQVRTPAFAANVVTPYAPLHARTQPRIEKPAALRDVLGPVDAVPGRGGADRPTQRGRASTTRSRSARQQHAVDHMDNAVRLKHVLDRDLGSIALGIPDHERVALALDRDLLAFDSRELGGDRKSTRLNSSHLGISYAV